MTEVRTALEQIGTDHASPRPSIAVLPFANMSGDKEQEYFSDGLAEEIINLLAHIPDLRVIARTSAFSFKGQNTDVRRVAEPLGVTHVLEGGVRKAGNRLRVTAQLITAHDGSPIWSERFDREMADVFAIQDEIAEAIASALKMRLSPQATTRRHTPPLPAYEALLKARHFLQKWTPESLDRGKRYYAMHGRMQEAVAFARKGHAQVPSHRGVIGQLAGTLKCAGDTQRAEALLAELGAGGDYGEPVGRVAFHLLCEELELAAGWLEKMIEQRDTRAPWISPHLFGPRFTSSSYWPRLAQRMNLPSPAG